MNECIEVREPIVLSRFHYWCGRHFDTDPFRAAVEAASNDGANVAYVVVGGDGYLLANVRERDAHVTVLNRMRDPYLPRKHNKGGQSAPRFGRLRDEAIQQYVKRVVESVMHQWPLARYQSTKMVVAGCGMLKTDVVEALSARARKRVVRVFDTAYSGRNGLQHAIDATLRDVSDSATLRADTAELQQLMETVQGHGCGKSVAIGRAEVGRALTLNAVERVIRHVDIEPVETDDNGSVATTIIESHSSDAELFIRGFGGIVAYLYWDVPHSLLQGDEGDEGDDDDDDDWM